MKKLVLVLVSLLALGSGAFGQGGGSNQGGGSSSGSSNFSGGTVIDASAAPYNVKPAKYVPDGTVTNGSAVVTCPNADCKFLTTAAVGNLFNATNMTGDISALTSVIQFPIGTTVLSVDSDTQIHASNNATGAGCTAACVMMWGVDQGANLAAVYTAASASCYPPLIPNGFYITLRGLFQTNNTACRVGQGVFSSNAVLGWSPQTSIIVPFPGLDPTTCTGGPGGNACFGGAQGQMWQNIEIYGMGNSTLPGTFNGKIGLDFDASTQCCGNYQGMNVYLNAWGANTSGFTGLAISGASGASFMNVRNDGMGAIGCDITTNTSVTNIYELFAQYCANNLTKSLFIHSSGSNTTVFSYGGVYGNNGATSGTIAMHVTTGSRLWSYGDIAPYGAPGGTSASALTADGAGTQVTLIGDELLQPLTDAASNAVSITNGAVVASSNRTSITAIGGSVAVNRVSGTFLDADNTTVISPGPTSIQPTCSVTGAGSTATCAGFVENEKFLLNISATGTGQAATGTLTLTFAGTFGTNPPVCTLIPSIVTGTNAWNARVSLQLGPTAPTTGAEVFTWDNNAVALTAAGTYQIYGECKPRYL